MALFQSDTVGVGRLLLIILLFQTPLSFASLDSCQTDLEKAKLRKEFKEGHKKCELAAFKGSSKRIQCQEVLLQQKNPRCETLYTYYQRCTYNFLDALSKKGAPACLASFHAQQERERITYNYSSEPITSVLDSTPSSATTSNPIPIHDPAEIIAPLPTTDDSSEESER